ncbi:MAG: apolipoprotein N-acyltransferase [Myxococcaceae bacterium]
MNPDDARAKAGIASWRVPVVATCVSAVLVGLFQRLDCAWLGFIALVPWLLVIEKSRKHAVIHSLILTAGSVALSFPWLVSAASSYGRIPPWLGWGLLTLGSVLLQPQFLTAGLVRGRVARVCTYLAVEALYPKVLGDTLGHGLYPFESFRLFAAWGGAALLTLLLLATNELIAFSLQRRLFWPGAVAALLLFVPLLPRPPATPHALSIEIAAVQSNLARYDRLLEQEGSGALLDRVLSTHAALHREATRECPKNSVNACSFTRSFPRPALVVWGEAIYPTTFGHPKSAAGQETDEALRRIVVTGGAPVLFGGYDVGEFNAAFLVDAKGRTLEVYRKTKLVPFGEFIPFGALWTRLGLLQGPTSWGRGDGPRTFSVGRLRIQPLICYEVLFPELTRETDADLLVVLSNDSWFESELQAKQHLAVAAFRSVETGRPQLRVSNTGLTSMIDARGEVISSLPANTAGVLRAQLPPASPRKPLLWWPAPLLALAFLFVRQWSSDRLAVRSWSMLARLR